MQNYFCVEKKVISNKAKLISVIFRIFLVVGIIFTVVYWTMLKTRGSAIIPWPKTKIEKLSTSPLTTKANIPLGIFQKDGKLFYIKSDGTSFTKSSFPQINFNLPYISGVDQNNINIAVYFLERLYLLQPIPLKVSFEDMENIRIYLEGDIVINFGSLENLDEKINKLKLLFINYSKLPAGINAIDLRWKNIIIKVNNLGSGNLSNEKAQ